MGQASRRARMLCRLAVVACGLGLAGQAIAAGPALAGGYHVEVCRNVFTGAAGPADGLTFKTAGAYVYGGANCTGLTGGFAAMDGSLAHPFGDSATWIFSAPPGTSISAFTLYRLLYAGPSQPFGTPVASLDVWTGPGATGTSRNIGQCAATTGCTVVGDPSFPMTPGNAVSASGLTDAASLTGRAGCGGGSGGSCLAGGVVCPEAAGTCSALVRLYALDAVLADGAPPQAANLTGPVVSGGLLAGTEEIAFDATDAGGGVYSQTTTVDGNVVAGGVVDTNGGRCRDSGGPTDGLRTFLYTVPCRTAVSVAVPIDTTALVDGTHTVRVVLDDAAGNTATAWSGQIRTRNAPQGGLPQLSGTAQQGQTLQATPGSWSPAPSTVTYQWLRCDAAGAGCAAIGGATSASYAAVSADAYHQLAVEVTAANRNGSTTARSGLSGVVADSHGSTTPPPAGPSTATATLVYGAASHVANGNGACGTATMHAGFAHGVVARVRLGRGATVHGRVTCAGHPIRDAVLDLTIRPASAKAAAASGQLRTAADGSFVYVVGPGPSRQLTIGYRAYTDDAAPVASARLELRVRPSLSLAVSPGRARNGASVIYAGRVMGGYLPRRGLPLDVQYRDGRRWRTFDQIRTRTRDGRFRYRYTFRHTTHPATYRFRVTIPRGGVSGYPYEPVASRVRTVRVVP